MNCFILSEKLIVATIVKVITNILWKLFIVTGYFKHR